MFARTRSILTLLIALLISESAAVLHRHSLLARSRTLVTLPRGGADSNVMISSSSEPPTNRRRRRRWGGRGDENDTSEGNDHNASNVTKSDDDSNQDSDDHEEAQKQQPPQPTPGRAGRKSSNTTGTQQQKESNRPNTTKAPPVSDPNRTSIVIVRPSDMMGRPYGGAGPVMMPNAPPPTPSSSLAIVIEQLTILATRLFILLWLRKLTTDVQTVPLVQRFVWERLNDRYVRDQSALRKAVTEPPHRVSRKIWKLLHSRQVLGKHKPLKRKFKDTFTRTVLVLNFETTDQGDVDQQHLTDSISFLLQQYRQRAFGVHRKTGEPLPVEVILLMESGGGPVSSYGLATAQVARIAQEPGVTLTVCVDAIAASGGYMVASQGHQIVAAPFASVGSIGAVTEFLNFFELAKRFGIRPITIKSGENKRTLSQYGRVNHRDERHQRQRLEEIHEAFKDLIIANRPQIVPYLSKVADGTVFTGTQAKELKLVDQLMTSDEYISQRVEAGDRVLRLHKNVDRRRGDLLPHFLFHWWNKLVKAVVSAHIPDVSMLHTDNFQLTDRKNEQLNQLVSWIGVIGMANRMMQECFKNFR